MELTFLLIFAGILVIFKLIWLLAIMIFTIKQKSYETYKQKIKDKNVIISLILKTIFVIVLIFWNYKLSEFWFADTLSDRTLLTEYFMLNKAIYHVIEGLFVVNFFIICFTIFSAAIKKHKALDVFCNVLSFFFSLGSGYLVNLFWKYKNQYDRVEYCPHEPKQVKKRLTVTHIYQPEDNMVGCVVICPRDSCPYNKIIIDEGTDEDYFNEQHAHKIIGASNIEKARNLTNKTHILGPAGMLSSYNQLFSPAGLLSGQTGKKTKAKIQKK